MSKLNKKIRKRERPAAIVKESTSVASRLPTKPRRKLTKKLTPKQIAAKKKGLIKDIPKGLKAKRLGASGNLGNIGAGVKGLYKAGKWMLKEYALGKGLEKIDKKISKKS